MFRPITSLYLGNSPTREVELIIKCRTEAQKRKNAQDYTVILKTTPQGHPISKFSTLSDALKKKVNQAIAFYSKINP